MSYILYKISQLKNHSHTKKIILTLILVTSTLSIYSQDEVYSYIENDIVNRIIIDKNFSKENLSSLVKK